MNPEIGFPPVKLFTGRGEGAVAERRKQALQHALFSAWQVIRNAKLWCDVESASQAKALSKEWDYNLVPGFTASKILWLKENEPENFEKLAKVLLPHDYFNWYLTGRYCAEVRPPQNPPISTRFRDWLTYPCRVWRFVHFIDAMTQSAVGQSVRLLRQIPGMQ